ncbi:MAG: methyltransferase domain-containing protein [Myxococcales bacterium]|nr:methyltransferase domain-containing protein [Myxococcales bacterium]
MKAELGSPPAGLSPEDVPRVYARWAPLYDWVALLESGGRRRCLELAGISNGEAVLEVAVGTGLLFGRLLELNPGGRNVAADLSGPMLRRARRRAARTGARFGMALADARRLGFRGNSFDAVLVSYLFDLLPEPDFQAVLGELRRVLRPGGRMVAADLAPARGLSGRLYLGAYRLSPALLGGCRGIDLRPHVAAAGFEQLHVEEVPQLFLSTRLIRALKPQQNL